MSFEIHRGTNISHWLSQSDRRGAERAAWFTRADVEWLAALGFDHLRLPVDEEQLWNDAGERDPEAFALLHDALGWCEAAGLRAIVDLHGVRAHHFSVDNTLFTDEAARQSFFHCWDELSHELHSWSADLVAYELLNEAVAPDPEQWNELVADAHALLRGLEPERTIVLGSNRWSSARTFPDLRVPDGDERLILTFHFYEPMLLTHYRAPWTPFGAYEGPIAYPGDLVPDAEWGRLSGELLEARTFDRAAMEEAIAPAVELGRRTGLPLYCGEFGVFETVPDALRERWYDDLLGVLEEHGVAWASWDFKGGFALVDGAGDLTAAGRAIERVLDS